MSSIYPSGHIYECHCGVAVVRYGAMLLEWNTGARHRCPDALEVLTARALDGRPDYDFIVVEAVERWLEARR